MSEQGNLNEYRIGKLEDDVKVVKGTIDSAKGAWWAICGAFGVLVMLVTLNVRFFGQHMAVALVEHYKEKTRQSAAAPSSSAP
jgi:hypothetical protein